MMRRTIANLYAMEVLDSRGNPTVKATVQLDDGTCASAIVPSGASTGEHEACELRDQSPQRYGGKGVLTAVEHINTQVRQRLVGSLAEELYQIDRLLRELDGTENFSKLGANAALAVSLACARASAAYFGQPLHRFIGGVSGNVLPVPMMNILNGGAHACNNVDIQEFMILPVGACCFSEALRWCSEVYHQLAAQLKKLGLSTGVGDEGGFAPDLKSDEEAIQLILSAVEAAGFRGGSDFFLALDCAASEWACDGGYQLTKSGQRYTAAQLTDRWERLVEQYPIISIEDPLGENDWEGWKALTQRLGGKVQLVGDDLFVTNKKRIVQGAEQGCANSVLIKPNQIGTVSDTIEAVKAAKRAGYTVVMSHRSGESEDNSIADLAVALNCGQIKTGAPARSERVAKYNRLLEIEYHLCGGAYPGLSAFHHGVPCQKCGHTFCIC